jgi:hypothetical protein
MDAALVTKCTAGRASFCLRVRLMGDAGIRIAMPLEHPPSFERSLPDWTTWFLDPLF